MNFMVSFVAATEQFSLDQLLTLCYHPDQQMRLKSRRQQVSQQPSEKEERVVSPVCTPDGETAGERLSFKAC